MDKIGTLTFQHQNIDTGTDLGSNTNTDIIKEVDIDTYISTYMFPLLSLPHLFTKQALMSTYHFMCVF